MYVTDNQARLIGVNRKKLWESFKKMKSNNGLVGSPLINENAYYATGASDIPENNKFWINNQFWTNMYGLDNSIHPENLNVKRETFEKLKTAGLLERTFILHAYYIKWLKKYGTPEELEKHKSQIEIYDNLRKKYEKNGRKIEAIISIQNLPVDIIQKILNQVYTTKTSRGNITKVLSKINRNVHSRK